MKRKRKTTHDDKEGINSTFSEKTSAEKWILALYDIARRRAVISGNKLSVEMGRFVE